MVCSSFSLDRLNVPNAPISVTPYRTTDKTKSLIWNNPYCAQEGHLKREKKDRKDRPTDHSGEIVTRALKAMSTPNLNSSAPTDRVEQTHCVDLTIVEPGTASLKSKSQSTFKRTFSEYVKSSSLSRIVNNEEKDFVDDRDFFLNAQQAQFSLNATAFIQNAQKQHKEDKDLIVL